MMTGPVEQVPFRRRGNEFYFWSIPGLQGTPDPCQHTSLSSVFKLCAFDHLLGLKSFQAPEFNRGADVFLICGTLSSLLSTRSDMGWEKRGRSDSYPLSMGICYPQWWPQSSPPGRGGGLGKEMDAPCSVPPGHAPAPHLYIHLYAWPLL